MVDNWIVFLAIFHHTIFYYTIFHYTIFHYTIFHYTIFQYIIFYYKIYHLSSELSLANIGLLECHSFGSFIKLVWGFSTSGLGRHSFGRLGSLGWQKLSGLGWHWQRPSSLGWHSSCSLLFIGNLSIFLLLQNGHPFSRGWIVPGSSSGDILFSWLLSLGDISGSVSRQHPVKCLSLCGNGSQL